MFTLFKNACVYSLRRDDAINLGRLNELLSAYPFSSCGAQDMSRTGWRPITKDSNQFCYITGKNILLVAQTQKKIMPPPVVKENLDARVDKLEQEQSRRLKKTEKDTLKDEVLHTLLPRAFTRNSFIQIWIDLERLRIVIDTTSPRNAENALALLRKSIGSLPVVPIMTVNPPALELTDWIKQQRAPVPFEMGESTSAKVMSILESGATATFKKEPVGSETLESSLSDGRLVCSLAICHAGEFLTEVTLTDDLIFKRIEFPDAFKDRNEDIAVDEDADKLARAEADFILMCDTLGTIISDALEAFGGESEACR
ncbi:recombination-associated protein RdgC [Pantoea sp. LMR881]|uniref:recombination-associated protein RdgC n=1 Tax=Pantoea sp. LMR881 TaxID=3014336 RepID=UPI0022B067F4|nr:recombination-associated protein RdgC [Pantoea sp. LMR881]MCZ4061276.1 recombination-associated protein RdgC [Pantoea sp. LMR881]